MNEYRGTFQARAVMTRMQVQSCVARAEDSLMRTSTFVRSAGMACALIGVLIQVQFLQADAQNTSATVAEPHIGRKNSHTLMMTES